MPGPLVVVGSINADLVLEIDKLPKPGETLPAKSFETFPGGKGANQAAAAAKLGHPTYLIGQIGSDSNGDFLMDSLASIGVNLTFVKKVKESTGTAVIMLQDSGLSKNTKQDNFIHTVGENSILIVGGANQSQWTLTPEIEQEIRTAGAVLLQREIPDSVNEFVARIASSASIPVVLDAGGIDTPLSSTILPYLDVLSPNETELARLTGMEVSNDSQVELAAKKLLSMGVKSVLVKLGARGCIFISNSEKLRQKAIPVIKVVDTTGAGDCFTAAFIVGLLEGMEKSKALKFASIAAAQCIQKKGAMSSLPIRKDVNFELSAE
eukprot:g866.t1